MKHELASEKLLELAYGDLSPREAREVEAHAAGCAACQDELAAIRETRSLMAQLPVERPPERGEGIVMAAARQAAESRASKRASFLPPWLWAGSIGAVAVAAVAVVSWQLGKTAPSGALRDRGDDLMGVSKPAEVAAAPAPASPPAAEKATAASEVAKGTIGEPAREEVGGPERRKAAVAAERPPRAAKRDAVAESLATSDRAPAAGAMLGEGAGSGGGRGQLAASPPPASAPPAPAAPRNVWAVPAEPGPEPVHEAAPLASSRAAGAKEVRAPSVAAAELQAHDFGATAARAEATEAPAATPAPKAERVPERKRSAAAPSAARDLEVRRTVETRSFPDCTGELRRTVERDAEGRIVRYVRIGVTREVDHRYGPDGRLVAAYEQIHEASRALPLDAPGLVRHARDAGIDAPPRCSLP